MKTKYSWSSFLQQTGREVTASSSAIQVLCKLNFFPPLVFLFLSPTSHRLRNNWIRRRVCQAVNILKITRWFGSFLLRFTCACSKRAFKLSITILGQEMKARSFVCSTPPLWGLPLTWESLKVMPVNQIHQSDWRERQRWPRPPPIAMASSRQKG